MYILTLFVEKHFIRVFTICQCTCLFSFFSKFTFFKYHHSVKQPGFRSGPTFVRPDLIPNCLQKLSVDTTSRQS